MIMASASDIAKYVIFEDSQPEYGELVTNLKLQKLLYYVQGFHLAILGSPIFDESILRWEFGPVVREVWDEYRSFGNKAIILAAEVQTPHIDSDSKGVINEVLDVYGGFTAVKLMHMTHEELPWKKTRPNGVISQRTMQDFFRSQLRD